MADIRFPELIHYPEFTKITQGMFAYTIYNVSILRHG